MKTIYSFLILLLPALSMAQMDEKVKVAYQHYRQLLPMLEDTTLSAKKRDSVIQIAKAVYAFIRKDREMRDSIENIGRRMVHESLKIYDILQSDSILTPAQRDSLTELCAYLGIRGGQIGSCGYKVCIDKTDALHQIDLIKTEGENLLLKSTEELIAMAGSFEVFPVDRRAAIKKLIASRHPAALDFLIKNLDTLLYTGPSDPGMYGRLPYYYTYEPDYPCFTILMENNPDWSFLPAIEKALKERIVEDYRVNLYGRLLDQIMKGCTKCRDELLIWYRDQSDQNRADGKRLRENAIRIMAYFANPYRRH